MQFTGATEPDKMTCVARYLATTNAGTGFDGRPSETVAPGDRH